MSSPCECASLARMKTSNGARRACLVATGFLALLAALARADSYDPVTVGARAEGMGGAVIAAARDLEAVPANPAGLLAISSFEVTLAGRVLDDSEKSSSSAGTTHTPTIRSTELHLAGLAAPLDFAGGRLVVALVYQRPLELVTHFLRKDIDGGMVASSPAAAVAVTPWLGAGLAVNFWSGVRDYSHDLEGGSHLWWKSEYSGTNATLGLMADLRHTAHAVPLRVGLSAHTPFDLHIDYRELTTTPGAADRADAWTYRVEMPWRVGLGLAWEPLQGLTVAADVEHRAFGDREIVAKGSTGTVESALSASGEDLTPVRLGAEYRLRLGEVVVPLRLGVRTVPTLRADRRDGKPTDQVVGEALTAGLGAEAGRFRVDLAWARLSYDAKSTTGALTTTSTRTYETWVLQGSIRLGS